jgi:hypothetical protein
LITGFDDYDGHDHDDNDGDSVFLNLLPTEMPPVAAAINTATTSSSCTVAGSLVSPECTVEAYGTDVRCHSLLLRRLPQTPRCYCPRQWRRWQWRDVQWRLGYFRLWGTTFIATVIVTGTIAVERRRLMQAQAHVAAATSTSVCGCKQGHPSGGMAMPMPMTRKTTRPAPDSGPSPRTRTAQRRGGCSYRILHI